MHSSRVAARSTITTGCATVLIVTMVENNDNHGHEMVNAHIILPAPEMQNQLARKVSIAQVIMKTRIRDPILARRNPHVHPKPFDKISIAGIHAPRFHPGGRMLKTTMPPCLVTRRSSDIVEFSSAVTLVMKAKQTSKSGTRRNNRTYIYIILLHCWREE